MCDTFIALPPATGDGSVIFAKNSDRPNGEGQSTHIYPAGRYQPAEVLACTYIEIPQARETYRILLSQIDWMWGGEMGANELGVVIGNEAVWTHLPPGPPALLGMDLLRLGLERGATARGALDVITSLLQEHGQGGACAEGDPGFTYDNSYLIADRHEAWVLETAGRLWVAERITSGVRNISNRLSIRENHDLSSADLSGKLASSGVTSSGGPVDFAASLSTANLDPEPGSRETWGADLLNQNFGNITPESMQQLLRHHDSGICMHGGFETTASMVSRLAPGGDTTHWLTDGPNPCRAGFVPHDGLQALVDTMKAPSPRATIGKRREGGG